MQAPAPASLLAATTLLVATSAHARTWTILNDGSGDAPTIQAGIDSSSSGDSVLVGPGTYYEDIDFLGKDLVLKSIERPERTVLDGTGQDSSVVIFKSGESRAAVLEGFAITNGRGTSFMGGPTEGGAIFCSTGSPTIIHNTLHGNQAAWGGAIFLGDQLATTGQLPAPLIEENIIESNFALSGGGGIYASQSRAIMRGNLFKSNLIIMEGDGGGIRLRLTFGSTAVVEQNAFLDNIASDQGGGIFVYTDDESGPVWIEGNLFLRNTAQGVGPDVALVGSGGGIATNRMNGVIRRNTIVHNMALPQGMSGGGGIRVAYNSPNLDISNNIIAFNKECGVVCKLGGSGNLAANIFWNNLECDLHPENCPSGWNQSVLRLDPYFCSPEDNDYRVASNSPAIASGDYFGAFPLPGCGPVSSKPITWGSLKARFRDR